MKKSVIAAVCLPALVALPGTAASADTATPWVHVRVEEAQKESRVNVNLPLSVVEAVLEATPEILESQGKVHIGRHHGMKIEDVRRVWKELAAAGDAELVTVEDEDETVKVWREGDQVHVRVEKAGREEVRVDVPVALVDAALGGEGESIDVKAALAELRKKRGDIVQVNDGESVVRIWIDEQNTQAK
jgi:hypothetical protein